MLVAGDDMNEPVADEVRSILDGHIILSRDLACAGPLSGDQRSGEREPRDERRGQAEHSRGANRMRETLATYEKSRT